MENPRQSFNEENRRMFGFAQTQRKFDSTKTLMIVSAVLGPGSLLIGGTFLSIAALVCAIIALVRARSLLNNGYIDNAIIKRLQSSCIIVLAIAAGALILNIVSMIILWPIYMEIINGNIDAVLNSGLDGLSLNNSGDSVWG